MTIRATIFLADDTTRSNDFESQEQADQWLVECAESQRYGDPSTYMTVTADVTEELAALSDEEDGKKARLLGSRVIDRLRGTNLRKGLTLAQLTAIAADPQIQLAKTLLDTGAPGFARDVINAVGPKYYTAAELEVILAPIQSV